MYWVLYYNSSNYYVVLGVTVYMKNKKIFIGFSVIVIALIIILAALRLSIGPVKDISLSDDAKQPIGKLIEIEPANKIAYNRDNSKLQFELDFSQQDVERIAYNSVKNIMKVDGLEADINDNNIKIYINTYLLSFIKTQYIIQLKPCIKNNTLVFTLENVNAGKIPISKTFAISKMKTLNMQNMIVDNYGISIENKAVEPFKFNSVYIENNKLKIIMNVQIKVIQDIKNIFNYKIPEGVKTFIKNLLTDFLYGGILTVDN